MSQNSYPIPQRSSLYRQQLQQRARNSRTAAQDEDDPYLRPPRSVIRYQPYDTTLQGVPIVRRARRRLPWYFYASTILAGILILYIVINVGGTCYSTPETTGHMATLEPTRPMQTSDTARVQPP